MPAKDWFGYYQQYFDTVELNNTFYHLPREKTVEGWKSRSGENFVFSLKASRYITHIKLLKDPREPLDKFFSAMEPVLSRTGAVLFQVPLRFKVNEERLTGFLEILKGYGCLKVFEFRHSSWWNERVYEILKKYNACFCWFSLPGAAPPYEVTSDSLYVRMHGSSDLYKSRYSDAELENLAEKTYNLKLSNTYIYFNNDYNGHAVKDALRLKEVLNGQG
jgi:uncharacterized protein YecE (DUF72 family)